MARYIPLRHRTRPYWITRIAAGWAVRDRRRCIGTSRPGVTIDRLHPTHAAAIAALDAHLREQAATEPPA